MLKKLALAAALALLVPAAANAQPWASPYYGQYVDRHHGDDDDDRYYGDDRPAYRYDGEQPYAYGGVPLVRGHPAYDEYGPDPNGLRAPDGHRLKCKLVDQWDGYSGQYVRRRQCW